MIPGPHLAPRPGHGGLGKPSILILVSRSRTGGALASVRGVGGFVGATGEQSKLQGSHPAPFRNGSPGPSPCLPFGVPRARGAQVRLGPPRAVPADASLPGLTPHTSSHAHAHAHTHTQRDILVVVVLVFFLSFFFFFLCTLQKERARACRTDKGTKEHYKNITICKISSTLSAVMRRGGGPAAGRWGR